MLLDLLAAEGSKTGRRHVMTLMRRMGIEALYRRPHTTKPEPGHKIFTASAFRTVLRTVHSNSEPRSSSPVIRGVLVKTQQFG
jgi:hypothetical protein